MGHFLARLELLRRHLATVAEPWAMEFCTGLDHYLDDGASIEAALGLPDQLPAYLRRRRLYDRRDRLVRDVCRLYPGESLAVRARALAADLARYRESAWRFDRVKSGALYATDDPRRYFAEILQLVDAALGERAIRQIISGPSL